MSRETQSHFTSPTNFTETLDQFITFLLSIVKSRWFIGENACMGYFYKKKNEYLSFKDHEIHQKQKEVIL